MAGWLYGLCKFNTLVWQNEFMCLTFFLLYGCLQFQIVYLHKRGGSSGLHIETPFCILQTSLYHVLYLN